MASSRKTILPAAFFDLRWIAAGLVMLLGGTLAWGLFGPEPPIRVARETTYLTAPLAAHGLPDYEAAMLASYGPAPPGPGRGRKSARPGVSGVVELSPFELLDRLAALVPPPRKHRHRYHGVFAPNHKP